VTGSRTTFVALGVAPTKLGGVERLFREIGLALAESAAKLVLCVEAQPAGAAAEALALQNVTIEVFPEQLHGLRNAPRLAKLLRLYRPHTFMYGFGGILRVYPWVAKLTGVKRVLYNDRTSRTPARRPLIKRALARAITHPLDAVIAVSHYIAQTASIEGFIENNAIHVVENGVDIHAADGAQSLAETFRRQHGIEQGCPLVLQVGSLSSVKGIDRLLRAYRSVVNEVPDSRLLFVGEGTQRAGYEAQAEALGLKGSALFLGALEDPLGSGAYAAADVVCQVSQWGEAFGFTIAEAMASARPVVGTRVGAIPEIIKENRSGYLVDAADEEGLTHYVLRLLASPSLRRKMGREGRRIAGASFDVRRTARRYIELF
jgi:glycosyltransferase involved in cell wall biosynthesis